MLLVIQTNVRRRHKRKQDRDDLVKQHQGKAEHVVVVVQSKLLPTSTSPDLASSSTTTGQVLRLAVELSVDQGLIHAVSNADEQVRKTDCHIEISVEHVNGRRHSSTTLILEY